MCVKLPFFVTCRYQLDTIDTAFLQRIYKRVGRVPIKRESEARPIFLGVPLGIYGTVRMRELKRTWIQCFRISEKCVQEALNMDDRQTRRIFEDCKA